MTSEDPRGARAGLRSWLHPTILSVAGLALFAGFGQFGVVVLLGDLAEAFSQPHPENGIAAGLGMTGTTVGIGLAIIRLSSLGGLWAAGIADRFGRRRVLITACAVGLALTAASAAAPTWWWFVGLFALGRPLLSGTNAVAGVIAAEETSSGDRAKAIALVGAAYALGTGAFTIIRAMVDPVLGFRGILALTLVPLLLSPLVGRRVEEPARYLDLRSSQAVDLPTRRRLLGPVRRDLIPRLALLCGVHFGVGLLTGPINSYLFLYGEEVLDVSPMWMSGLFVVSGLSGLLGLIIGRAAADRIGRRVTAGCALVVGCLAAFGAYSGPLWALAVGHPLTIMSASAFTPAAGALDAELFPTSSRATAAGWLSAAQVLGAVTGLAAFGIVVEVTGSFTTAAAMVSLPVVLLALLYLPLPETRGMELEESAPEDPDDP